MGDWGLYFVYLCDIVHAKEQTLYWYDILYALHCSEFVIRLAKDANRVEDAEELRNEFRDNKRLPRALYGYPIGIFEVLVALARRGEWEIMHDPSLGDRTPVWFWAMMNNLGLQNYAYLGALDDPKCDLEVMKIVENFVERGYDRDGNGGPFFVRDKNIDMRRAELWDQMCYYFDQFF